MTMRRLLLPLLPVLALALLAPACHRKIDGKTAATKLLAHTDAMIQILKDHEADPPAAAKELAAYQEKNQAEIEQLKQAMGEYMQKDRMAAAAVSAIYGLKSAELSSRMDQLAAKTKGP